MIKHKFHKKLTPLLVISVALLGLSNLPALGQNRVQRYSAIGQYSGVVEGKNIIYENQFRKSEEYRKCSINMNFHSNGQMTFSAAKYFSERVVHNVNKNSGAEQREITRTISISTQDTTITSQLSLWLSPQNLIQRAVWQRTPQFLAKQEYVMQQRNASTQWQWKTIIQSRKNVSVFCELQILWTGPDRTGLGQPLRGQIITKDYYRSRPWLTIKAQWNLQPLRGSN